MPGRFLAAVVAVFAMALPCASSGAASKVSFDGQVLRCQGANLADSDSFLMMIDLRATDERRYWQIGVDVYPGLRVPRRPFDPGRGCFTASPDPAQEVHCPLTSPRRQPRYSFEDLDSRVQFFGDLRGVVYAGEGDNEVWRGDRVYGGPGADDLTGVRLHGGPGSDQLEAERIAGSGRPVLHGGPGRDFLEPPGWLYGGPGPDTLEEFQPPKSADMLVGGPGEDYVSIEGDGYNDVVRVRGGGTDIVQCFSLDPRDVVFADRSDDLDGSCKRQATVLYTERPRYPYP